jgi:hypothetical protein
LFSKYAVLGHDLKGCITSIDVVDMMKYFRSQPRIHFLKSTAFALGAVDAMAATLFLMLGREYLSKSLIIKGICTSLQRVFFLSPAGTGIFW